MSLVEFDTLHLPRNAFSPREAARAGDIWRLLQEAAILGSSHLGWHPARYRAEGTAFVVRRMTVVHGREVAFGEPLAVRTWVSTFRGGRFSNRQVRVLVDGEAVTRATQEWLHVRMPELRISRAPKELLEVFTLHELDEDAVLPEKVDELEGPVHAFEFDAWITWMDPLAHANHPLYVDWIDEALGRRLHAVGADPHGLVPIAEQVSWRTGVEMRDRVRVETRMVGRTEDGAVVCEHDFRVGDKSAATATTVRSFAGDSEVLVRALS